MADEIQQLQRALETRDIIGQAKGVLMERFDIDATEAFRLLVRLSQNSNTPVAELAGKLILLDHPSR
jgi:AmiR/NasT family two-component response regulator